MFKELFTESEKQYTVKISRGDSGLLTDALGGELVFGSPKKLYVNKILVGTYDARAGEFTSFLTPEQIERLIKSQQGVYSSKDTQFVNKLKADKVKSKDDILKIFTEATSPEIKKAYDDAMKTKAGTPERKAAIEYYQTLRKKLLKNIKEASQFEWEGGSDAYKDSREIEKLISGFDFYAHMIDDYKRQQKIEGRNDAIKAKLKDLGVTSIALKGGKEKRSI